MSWSWYWPAGGWSWAPGSLAAGLWGSQSWCWLAGGQSWDLGGPGADASLLVGGRGPGMGGCRVVIVQRLVSARWWAE